MKTISPNEILAAFVLEHSEGLALPQRVRVYRAMAQVAGDERDALLFTKLADELEAAHQNFQQLVLDFKRVSI